MGFRNGAPTATSEAVAVPPSSIRTMRSLLRPVFAMSTISLLVYLLVLDGGAPDYSAARRELKTDGASILPESHLEIDEHGESFAGVRYADDPSSSSSSRTRDLEHVSGHILVKLDTSRNPDVYCSLLAELVSGSVENVIKGPVYNGCTVVPSEFARQAAGDSLPLTGSEGVQAVEDDGIVEAFQENANWAIWNLDRMDQCDLPLDGAFTMKEDATGVKVFIMDTGVRGDHQEFVGMIDPSDGCHYSIVDYPMMPLTDGNGHG
jgi:hypothetical protein